MDESKPTPNESPKPTISGYSPARRHITVAVELDCSPEINSTVVDFAIKYLSRLFSSGKVKVVMWEMKDHGLVNP
jgi:hypothetical protein